MIKDFGLVTPPIYASHYFAGTLPKDILCIDGDWTKYLPQYEPQNVNFETFACSIFGTGHSVETLMNKIFATNPNYAERYHYNLVGITPPTGGDPQVVAESIRKNGMIDQNVLPMTSTLQEFETPRPMSKDLIAKGQTWLLEHSFLHEWLWTTSPDKQTRLALMKEYLQYSPLALSVTAWYPPVNGMYPDNGAPNTHWVCCFKLDGDSPVIFDSYAQDGNPIKKLSPDHHIEMCKRYYIGIAGTVVQKENWISGMIRALLETLGIIQKEINTMPKTPTTPVITPVLPPKPIVQPTPAILSPTITKWANLVTKYEGANQALNNPGNFKYSSLMASWGGQKAGAGSDGGFFCKFPDQYTGFKALCNFLTLGAENQLLDYHTPPVAHPDVNPRTIKGFTLVYTNFPKPEYDYSDNLIKELGVSADTQISSFIINI